MTARALGSRPPISDWPTILRMKRLAVLGLLLLVGCGGPKTAGTPTSNTTAASATASQPSKTAEDALAAIQAKRLPVAETINYTVDTDPNHLLGRPHGYTSKVAWHDSRTDLIDPVTSLGSTDGGTIEVFDNASDAKARYDYIDTLQKSMGGLSGNDYQFLHGDLEMRIASGLTPDQAKQYDSALGY